MDKSRLPNLPEPRSRSLKLRKRAETITANRVTLLPGFLQQGVRSETVRKSSHYDAEVLSENLHGLLRRSTRLAGKERSKSIFKEIEEKYARRLNHDFGARLFASLGPEFGLRELEYYKQGVREEVEAVNDVLAGRADMSVNRKRAYCEEEKENYPLKIYVPPTKWVFQTPPNRKLNYSNAKVEDTCLKPAILETRNEGKVVYEVNNKINVDFSRYSNRQELDIDKRYMVEVGNTSEDFTFQIHEQEAEKKFEFQTDPFELENHFLNLTCRPKKAQCAVSRMPVLKRKRDIFEPEASGSTELETVNEFDSSFTFINNNLSSLEESFTFKFTANEGATTGHIFDFDGNKKDTFDFRF